MEYTTSSIVDSFPFEPTDINASNLSSVNESSESNMSKISYLTPRLDMEEEGVTFAKVIELYVVPILVVTGAIGNCLILLTVRQRNMRNWSICFYLAAYAVGNIIILVPMVGAEWLCHVTSTVYITKLTDWTCKLWQFIMGVTIYSGIWFVFAMLVDQYIAIWLPYKAQSLCTIFMAKFAIVIIIIGLTVVSVHAIWTYELFQNGCYILHTPNDLLTLVWPWVSLSFYCIIPLVLIFIFIALVLYGTFTKTTWKKSASNYQVPMDITVMTIALSIFYVIFVTPATVINIIKINLPNSWLHDEEFYRNLVTIVVVVGDLLTYLNPTLAFVICFAFSSTFRLELKEKIRCMCCENVTRIYEMQVNSSASGAGNDPENCSETTPL
ncbi:probable G-protein coupled receptor 139 [Mya arenaria]|uniref:probable G-protein coupled receptor 139 n=1 Tax=Mya arenaria TaxID=6604 RepID=UPI0022E26ED1|nr:probable G-protein coupled receptor 139 [Mya arenaria]